MFGAGDRLSAAAQIRDIWAHKGLVTMGEIQQIVPDMPPRPAALLVSALNKSGETGYGAITGERDGLYTQQPELDTLYAEIPAKHKRIIHDLRTQPPFLARLDLLADRIKYGNQDPTATRDLSELLSAGRETIEYWLRNGDEAYIRRYIAFAEAALKLPNLDPALKKIIVENISRISRYTPCERSPYQCEGDEGKGLLIPKYKYARDMIEPMMFDKDERVRYWVLRSFRVEEVEDRTFPKLRCNPDNPVAFSTLFQSYRSAWPFEDTEGMMYLHDYIAENATDGAFAYWAVGSIVMALNSRSTSIESLRAAYIDQACVPPSTRPPTPSAPFFATASAYDPLNPEYHYMLGLAFAYNRQTEALSMRANDDALALDPGSKDALDRAISAASKEKLPELVKTILADGHFSIGIYWSLVRACKEKNLHELAAAVYDKMMELYPNNYGIKSSAGRSAFEHGDYSRAVTMLDAVWNATPAPDGNNADEIDCLAMSYILLGDAGSAHKVADRLLTLSKYPEHAYHLHGSIYIEEGRYTDALRELAKTQTSWGTSTYDTDYKRISSAVEKMGCNPVCAANDDLVSPLRKNLFPPKKVETVVCKEETDGHRLSYGGFH